MRAEIELTDAPEKVFAADKIIFSRPKGAILCAIALQQSGLGEAVSDGLKNKPFFGICVGAQLLFDQRRGQHTGLGLVAGEVKRFAANQHDAHGDKLKVPHMGWNTVHQTQAHPLFERHCARHAFLLCAQLLFRPGRARNCAGQQRISA